MEFPSANDFLEEFGMEPTEIDPNLALCRYTKKSQKGEFEVDISFSAVMQSFQVILRDSTQDIAVISSESVRSIELFRDVTGAGVRVVFEVCKSVSEARVMFEPEVSCRWWTLRKL
ncbi:MULTISPECIES: hypothetical protein [Pseudomonas]|jgi:hypothetical protein|uniref:Uncharacterized protein n=1 Tax=Pseudomonas coleopterorum TaxID=1605838 RepID=A0AAJ6M045_9PSED|nr:MULTISPECIES: hypothetical protein [Pseudomonas]MEB2873017.1 hypothetical protein [Pseudomonas rhizosphaerae]WNC09831.1 hypothetical protein RI108_21715 [Pseudomonas coleopterorum]